MTTESKFRHLLRKRIVVKKRRPAEDGTPRDYGVGLTGVIVSIVILGILAAVGGPPLFSLIFDAREHKLENNVREAAQIVHQRLTLEPEWMDGNKGAQATTGRPTATLGITLVEDAPYTWANNAWEFQSGDDDETIRVEFINQDTLANVADADANVPPTVDWIASDWRAVRLHARNSDGRWACALIVVQANVNGTQAGTVGRYAGPSIPTQMTAATGSPTAEQLRTNARLANAWISGIWYDSGDVVTADNGRHDFSPVDDTNTTAADKATLPTSASTWQIEDNTTGTGNPNVVRTLSRAL